jgi:hypothetical protein
MASISKELVVHGNNLEKRVHVNRS